MTETGRPAAWSVHGVVVLVGEAGVFVRGGSGSGKSSLALSLLSWDPSPTPLEFVRLVADDRLRLQVVHGRLLARPHPKIAGLVERRGEGIFPIETEPAAVVRCVVDLVAQDLGRDIPPRLPSEEALTVVLGGVALPRLCLPQRLPGSEAASRVRSFVHRIWR